MTNYQNAASVEELWRRMAERPGRENRELDLTLQVPLIIGCTPDARPYIMILSQKRPWPINPDVYLEVQHPCWSCNSNSSSANASAGVR